MSTVSLYGSCVSLPNAIIVTTNHNAITSKKSRFPYPHDSYLTTSKKTNTRFFSTSFTWVNKIHAAK